MIFTKFSKHLYFHTALTLFVVLTLVPQFIGAQEHFWVSKDPPKSHYKIEVKIDVDNDIVEGREVIILPNNTSKPIHVIALDWSISDKFSIDITAGGKPLALLNSKNNSPTTSPLFYRLPEPLMPGSKSELDINFKGNISFRVLKPSYIPAEKHWYPRLWWDGLTVFESFQVKIDVPERYAVAASGLLNKETGYFENPGASSFGIYLGKDHQIETREVDGILISTMYTDKSAQCLKFCLETAVDVVKFYKDWLGIFPHKYLHITPGVPHWGGGSILASGIVYIHGQERFENFSVEWWKLITAHEIGHIYWGDYVIEGDNPKSLWIGMGMFADGKYVNKRINGNDSFSRMNNYLNGISNYFDLTIDVPPAQLDKQRFYYSGEIEHSKAFCVLSALESVLGEETFDTIYKKCLMDYGGKRFGYRDLWRVSEEVSGENLSWFFEQWLRSNKYLCYQIESKECAREDEKFISTVQVKCAGTMKMPVPVQATFEDDSQQIKCTDRNLDNTILKFESISPLKEIALDPEKKLAMLEQPLPEVPKEAAEILALGWPDDKEGTLELFNLLNKDKSGLGMLWYWLGRNLWGHECLTETFQAFDNASVKLPQGKHKFVSFVWKGIVKDLLGEREEAIKQYKESLNHDIGETVDYGRGIKMNSQWVEERIKTPFKREEKK